MRLLRDQAWPEMTAAVRRSAGRCRVAVAYFGKGASRLLPLRRGSVAVLDFSEGAVRAGHACPEEVLVLLRRGVEVHSVANLHAKVVVAGRTAFVGSANASRSSAEHLIEAVVQTRDPRLVAEARDFVESLRGEHVSEDYARELRELYRDPKYPRGVGPAKTTKTTMAPKHQRTWIVQLEVAVWDEADRAAQDKGTPMARRRLQSKRRFVEDSFKWSGAAFSRRVARNDRVIQVFQKSPRLYLISPPERVLAIQKYRDSRGRSQAIVFVEKPRLLRRKTLAQVRRVLGRSAAVLKSTSPLLLVRDPDLAHDLHRLWPSIS